MDESSDREISDLLGKYEFRYLSYSNVLADHGISAVPGQRLKIWSRKSQRLERSAFRSLLIKEEARGLVISVGTPGQFAGASGAHEKALYILHTYPHGRRQRWLAWAIMSPLFVRTPNFLSVSKFQKIQMERFWGLARRSANIEVVPNTAGLAIPLGEKDKTLPLVVLTASWVEAYKAPFFWIDVAEHVTRRLGPDQVRFRWIGEGSLLRLAQAVVAERGLSSSVDFAGHIEEVHTEFESAVVYFQPSITENMSLSVIEAFRVGVPCVVSRVGGLTEIVEEGKSGFTFEPGDIEVAAGALESLLESAELRDQMGGEAHKRFGVKFSQVSWNESMRKLHYGIFDKVKNL